MESKLAHERLKRIAKREESELPLAESALVIAACRDPEVDVDYYLGRIDQIVAEIRGNLPRSRDFVASVRALTRYLSEDEGFRGNTGNYADPRNSFLSEVLDRKVGIPITLSVLYIEIGARLGLDVRGLSFPGHFLVRFGTGDDIIVLDPFFGGVSLSGAELFQRMRRFASGDDEARVMLVHVLRGAPKAEILARILRNLREIYFNRGDLADALIAADQSVMLTPGEPHAIRCRADLYFQLEVGHSAAADYRRYLQLLPDAPDAEDVRGRLIELGDGGRLN